MNKENKKTNNKIELVGKERDEFLDKFIKENPFILESMPFLKKLEVERTYKTPDKEIKKGIIIVTEKELKKYLAEKQTRDVSAPFQAETPIDPELKEASNE